VQVVEAGEYRAGGAAQCAVRAIRLSGRQLKRRMACFCLLIALAIMALVGAVVVEQREAAIQRAEGDAANLSAAFEEEVRRVMNNVSGAMDLLSQRIETEGAAFDLSEWTRQVPELAASTIQVSLIDEGGKLVATTLDPDPKPLDLSDREHFRVHRDSDHVGLFVGKPVRGRVSNVVTIQVTKRLNKPDGSFGGVLVFSLDPEFLTSLHRSVDLGQTGSIALVGQDGIIRARFTSTENLDSAVIGTSIAGSQAVVASHDQTAGRYASASLVDSIVRLFHWRKVTGYPLVVVVGLGKAEALAAANEHAKLVLALGGIALALPLLTMLMLSREITRRVDHEIALHDEDQKLRAVNGNLVAQREQLLRAGAELAVERRKLEDANAELKFAKQQADEASRAKSSFLANMSHELRTPLNAIIGFAEIIRDRIFGDDLARYSDCASDIQVSGVHLLNIINDVLDVAKIEAGRFTLCEDVVALDALAASALLSVKPQAAAGQIDLVVDLPEDGTHLRCDETKFKQIIINLLSNAIKFTAPGGLVTLRCQHAADGGLQLSVTDTGIGMTEDELARAFELFRQVDNRIARRYEGTGLGLPLAVQLAELHDAVLKVESTPGVGTAALLSIPAARVLKDAPATDADDADRRRAPRDPIRHVVFVQSDQQRFETRTVDLSETGIRIEHVAGLVQGDKVRVDLGADVIEGIVVWQNQSHVGLRLVRNEPSGDERTPWPPMNDAA
jgi:signal transduction histidine kinase